MGVVKNTLKPGNGEKKPKKGMTCTVHYTGYVNQVGGVKFDSSVDRGQPFQFKLGVGQVIRGWDEGVLKMGLGEKCTLTCSPDYAYGEAGSGDLIPPNATLVFEVELLSFK